jgi:hypothetical protein
MAKVDTVNYTDLVLDPIGVVPYSARGLDQTVAPIAQSAVMKRTVLGDLDNVASEVFQLYKSTITCDDLNVPGLDGIFAGTTVTVDCIFELSYKTSGGSASRTVITGSSRTEGAFTFYRPRLVMKIVDFNYRKSDWGVNVGWQMDLEEIPS